MHQTKAGCHCYQPQVEVYKAGRYLGQYTVKSTNIGENQNTASVTTAYTHTHFEKKLITDYRTPIQQGQSLLNELTLIKHKQM